jgi:2-polyprenyl-3-methyl-5-hydroxy-6-metoxy-1,4-benzoquinol methylase
MDDNLLRRHPLGFLEVAQRPSPTELSKYYADHYYQESHGSYQSTYSSDELACIRLRVEQRASHAMALRPSMTNRRLLDVGCGEGFVLAHFERLGWDVAGIDFSIAGVSSMNPSLVERVDQGDIFTTLQSKLSGGATYDVVWLGHVLEHVLDPIGMLQSLRQLVSDDGVLVVTVPNDGSEYQEGLLRDGLIDRRFWIAIPDHMSYFTSDSLRAAATATGWSTMDILASFPIDLYLAHPSSSYVRDRSQGPAAHKARLRFEALVGAHGSEAANRLYSALAQVGLGRDLTAFLKPTPKDQPS